MIDTDELTTLRAQIAALDEDNDVYRELHERLAADNVKLREKVAAVLRIMRDATEAQCYCDTKWVGVEGKCMHCEAYARAKAIAEGKSCT